MSENENEQAEYERALEVLNRSKGERVKKIKEQKKKKKQKEQEHSSEKGNGFWSKCKKDPIIPAAILILIAAVVFFVIRVIVPMFSVKTLGITIDEYREQYASGSIYNSALMPYNFAIPEVTMTDGSNVALTAAAESRSKTENRLMYFTAAIPNTSTDFGTGIQGSVRKSDGKITAMRVMAGFRPEYAQDTSYMRFLVLYFGSYLQGFIPDVSDQDIQNLILDAINQMQSGEYIIRQDLAYKISVVNNESVTYIAFDIMPSANV